MGLIEIPNKDVDDFIILRLSDRWSTWCRAAVGGKPGQRVGGHAHESRVY